MTLDQTTMDVAKMICEDALDLGTLPDGVQVVVITVRDGQEWGFVTTAPWSVAKRAMLGVLAREVQ